LSDQNVFLEVSEEEGHRYLKGLTSSQQPTGMKLNEIFNLEKYHSVLGHKGKGVKIAIFDSGLSEIYSEENSDSLSVKRIINFTHDKDAIDHLGHGTFIAGVAGSKNYDCPGIAPDAEVYVMKLFTEDRVSYTSWFLDAFNFVL
jgi:subtilisin family serine protease